MKILGVGLVVEQMRALTLKHKRMNFCDVGYKTDYAVFVHEDLTKLHGALYNAAYEAEITAGRTHPRRPDEQAKFLEGPARQYKNEIEQIIFKTLTNKESLDIALKRAANFLLKKSLEIVPVDTGRLRDSAYVKVY